MLNVRKLAALDIHFLGPRLIVSEFAAGVAGPVIFGILTLRMAQRHAWPFGLTLFGAYLLTLGLNYVPLLLHAVSLVRSRAAFREIEHELSDRSEAFRRYRRQSLYLLVPFVVPIIAFAQLSGDRVRPEPDRKDGRI